MDATWWLLTLFGFFWIAGAVAFFLQIRQWVRRAKEQGFIDNGLGTRISAADNPTSFRLIIYGWHFMSAVGVLFVAAGAIGIFVRFVQAL